MSTPKTALTLLAIMIAPAIIAIGTGAAIYQTKIQPEWRANQQKIAALEQIVQALDQKTLQQTASSTLSLEESAKQITTLKNQLDTLERERARLLKLVQTSSDENRQAASRENVLTSLVAKTTPGVVSIVISKDVPTLEIMYVNPFGDDPFFKNFDVRVPTYRQKGTERKKVGAGTGFFISKDGYILTNKHVVADEQAEYTVLLQDGSQKKGSVTYKDPVHDLALIKIDGTGYTKISLGDSDALKLGQTVIAIGNALGEYNNSVSVGIISGLNRNLDASGGGKVEHLKGVIQTDAAINPGNSGGPMLNLQGQAVGINVATVIGSQNVGFAIPINTIKQILQTQKIL